MRTLIETAAVVTMDDVLCDFERADILAPSVPVVLEGGLRRVDLAGAAHLELVSAVVQLRPEGRAMFEAEKPLI
ncbi:hypothetical protein [Saccharopolyspora spinosa]|uniref:Uncharacterized protein n=1 Tax=Saccharopolyspora spinosa TaxID=60894 RepID=A0A2N3Y6I0_SACSN|nr:hypothetical protein [Saccharopolyspora spinosa]PKW18552.1 hypothetical protein A8926_6647 [Saccharopolyspora spinosa]